MYACNLKSLFGSINAHLKQSDVSLELNTIKVDALFFLVFFS